MLKILFCLFEFQNFISVKKVKSGRANAVFGNVADGKFIATDGGKYGSGMIKPLLKSNAIYLSDPNESEILENSEIFAIRLP